MMYLWIGCKLPEDFEQEIRSVCLKLNKEVGLDTVAFELPQHISLKISFQTDEPDAVVEDLTAFLSAQRPFSVRMESVDQEGGILWMPAAENGTLQQLHKQLDTLLESRFGIPQHEFDKCFQFHSTLFMDNRLEKIRRMKMLLGNYPVDRELQMDTFLLGQSETGKPGSYHVIRQIKV